jgi:hypothetical protein
MNDFAPCYMPGVRVISRETLCFAIVEALR